MKPRRPPPRTRSAAGAPDRGVLIRLTASALALAAALFALPARAAELRPLTPTPAAPLVLRDLDGRGVDLAQLRGKLVLVNFWATYCKPCRAEMPSLDRLRTRLAPRGMEVLGVDVGEDADAVRRFTATVPVGFPLLLDPEGATMARWKAIALPTTLVIDRRGRLRARLTGEADWDGPDLVAALEKLMTEP
ncbi:MAG: TlpA family protein disulfide reductase [Azonexus sp.]|nr:TlpA family protein disulfide reductase [Betaproteobacteria bacterium]MBK8916547.1 TlpA family protein disulfide reductase [Betaproteobacteria bacterium]MBP6036888.1 TlpA family protein disulfide reductase [Azonexus sp.]MBP6907496.1 TlpA family protein disulfide reductase [Azonexus sp.]